MNEPRIEVEPDQAAARHRARGGRKSARKRLRRWLLYLVIAVVIIGLLPAVLSLAYRSSAVRPVSTLMVADLVMLRGYDRRWVPLEEISPNLVNAVMMSEDGQFCAHRGVDWGEFNAVLQDFRAGAPARGASTIPMQTVKNLFLWPGRSYLRKALEMPLALYFDGVVPKKRIMEIYLNMAEWGPGIYGAEAAAQHYFNRPASALSARQGALMAATLPNPIARNPAQPTSGMNRIANIVERRAGHAGGYNRCVQ